MTDYYLGNISLIKKLWHELAIEASKFPTILNKILYNGNSGVYTLDKIFLMRQTALFALEFIIGNRNPPE